MKNVLILKLNINPTKISTSVLKNFPLNVLLHIMCVLVLKGFTGQSSAGMFHFKCLGRCDK